VKSTSPPVVMRRSISDRRDCTDMPTVYSAPRLLVSTRHVESTALPLYRAIGVAKGQVCVFENKIRKREMHTYPPGFINKLMLLKSLNEYVYHREASS
jgi:hypothetical protein